MLTGFTRSLAWCVTACADAGVSMNPTIWLTTNSIAITPSILPAKIVTISFRVRPSARRRRSVFTIVPSLFPVRWASRSSSTERAYGVAVSKPCTARNVCVTFGRARRRVLRGT